MAHPRTLGIIGMVTHFLAGLLQAQALDLKGRVVLANGSPVAEATVDLKIRGLSTKTAADGSFALTSNVAVARTREAPLDYRLMSDALSVEAARPEELRLEILNSTGRVQGAMTRHLGTGRHRINLTEVLPASGGKAGLYFLRLRLGGEVLTHPFLSSGKNTAGTIFAPPYREVLAKRTAVVDTLRIRKTGYQDLFKAVESYTAGNLGDLTLAASPSDGWVNLFNGKDLTGWTPLIHRSKVGINTDSTFRPDPENNGIRVSYDKYTGDFGGGNCKCGNLYYNKFLTNYRIRVTYRFFEPQAGPNPPSWGKNNSGLMIFGIDPAKVTGDPVFPPILEIQLLANPSGGGSTTANYCDMAAFTNPFVSMTHTGSCGNNRDSKAPGSGKPLASPTTWTTIEADVHVNGETKVYIWPDTVNPALIMSKPMYGGQPVTGGYMALQSESQPIVFKDILLKELPQ